MKREDTDISLFSNVLSLTPLRDEEWGQGLVLVHGQGI
jgi:hypothetical protein